MATITFGSSLAIAGTYRVYLKQTWGDTWTLNEKIVLQTVTWSAQPSLPAATLSYQYGPAIERATSTASVRTKLDINGWWVRLEIDCPDGTKHWCGFVDSAGDHDPALDDNGGSPVASGRQSFTCVGVIQSLAYSQLDRTFFNFKSSGGTESVKIARSSPIFNETYQNEPRPRMTRENTKLSGENSFLHIFNQIYNRGRTLYTTWSTRDICEHLVDRYKPLNSSGSGEVEFIWKSGALARLPDNDKPFVDCNGRNLLEVLDSLLRSSALYGYFAALNLSTGKVELDTFTYTQATITLGSFTVPANANQHSLAMVADSGTRYTLQTNVSDFYHQVVARGAARQVIATVRTRYDTTAPVHYRSSFDSELTTRITDRLADIVADGALAHNEKATRILATYDAPEFIDYNVAFGPAAAWDYTVSSAKLFEDEPGSVAYWPSPINLRLADNLPLSAAQDYSAGFTLGSIGAASTELLPNQVFSDKITGLVGGSGSDKDDFTFHATEKMYWGNRHLQTYYDKPEEPPFSIFIEKVDGLPIGFRYVVEGASSYQIKQQGDKAYSTWMPHMPSIDCKRMLATVCFEEDRRLEKPWPTTLPSGKDTIRKLYVDNDRYKYIRIMLDTLLYTNNAVYKVPSTTSVKDDSTELENLAKRLASWFTVPRRVLRVSSVRTTTQIEIGVLIEKVDPTTSIEQTVNTVVTQITMAFSDRPGMEIETQSGQLDPIAFLPTDG
jgi:hypothetical protein